MLYNILSRGEGSGIGYLLHLGKLFINQNRYKPL